MTDRGLNDEFDDLHRAVREFGRVEIEALSRRVIYRLQRITAVGIFGDGYIYKSVWDEFCHEVQEGPHTMLEDAWDSLVESHIADAVKRVAIESAVLLTIYAVYQLDEDEAAIPLGTVWPEGIAGVVESALSKEAGNRTLEHLGPLRDYC